MVETSDMLISKRAPATTLDADMVRGNLLHLVEHNAERSLVSFFAAATLTTLLFYQRSGNVVLAWYVVVLFVSIWRIWTARRINLQPPVPIASGAIVAYIPQTVVIAAILTSFPAWEIMVANGSAFAYMNVLFVGIFWSASATNAPIPVIAAAFMLTQMLTTVVAAFVAGMTTGRAELAALYALGAASGMFVTVQTSRVFRKAFEQKIELQGKSETIALLLKEYEEQSSDWLWQTDAALRIVEPSQRFVEAMGGTRELAGRTLFELLGSLTVDLEQPALAELAARMQARRSFSDIIVPLAIESETLWFSIAGRPTQDRKNAFAGYRGVMVDITEARQAQARALHLTHHDALTDLPNRAQFSDLLQRMLARDRPFVLLSVDLDRFKSINEVFGHRVGDATLIEIAKRLQERVDTNDVVARLGDDEFVILTWRLDTAQVGALCRDLIEVASQPVRFEAREVAVGASIGVAFAPSDGQTSGEILKSADQALVRAKADGRGTFRFFSAEMDRQLLLRQQLLQDLRKALADEEFVLHYQPIVDARTGRTTGCEALIRWHHPTRGLLSPAEFISIAEETGLIVPIGDWVIGQACREAAGWPGGLRVSVNVSPIQITTPALEQRIRAHLEATGLAPHRLEVEITETVLVNDSKSALETLNRIRALGTCIALDDFGTGYSSLSYLRHFPFDRIKIDRAFVQNLETSDQSKVIVQAILDIASGFGMTQTAEGIETEAQASYLRNVGCAEFQGFLFARPCTAEVFRDRWACEAAQINQSV